MSETIYLDNNATSQIDEAVLAAMIPVLQHTGNASSVHEMGRAARAKVDSARSQVADLVGASAAEVVFTSGATEANNLAIKGVMNLTSNPPAGVGARDEVITSTIEHPSVRESVESLSNSGYKVIIVGVDGAGQIALQQLRSAVSERTALVSVIAANNETGAIAPMNDVIDIARGVGALVHTDATQLMTWGFPGAWVTEADLVSLSAHKMHGPQGIGALIVRRAVQSRLRPVAHGGGHERGLRSGTLNAAGIVGFGAAAKLAISMGAASVAATQRRRDQLETTLRHKLGSESVLLNGHRVRRLPGTLNVSIAGVDAEALVATTPEVAMSTGSACSEGVPGSSEVLRAMRLPEDRCASAVRLSLSRSTTDRDIAIAADIISQRVVALRVRMNSTVTR